MTDVWHLKSSGTGGWMESGQINAITQVSGEMGTKGHSLSACSPELLARLEHQVCFCMEWQTSDCDHTSATSPWGPHRCLTKSSGRSASQTWPRWMWWVPRLACSGGYTTTSWRLQCQALQKPPLSFSVRPNIPCGAYLKNLLPQHVPSENPMLFLFFFFLLHSFSTTPSFLATLSVHLSELPGCEWCLKSSICPWIPIYQLVSAYIDLEGIGSYTVQWGVILFMHAHSAPGLYHSSNSGCKHTVTCMLYYISANWINCW